MVAKDFYMIDIDNDGLLIEFNDIRIDEDTDLFEYSKDGDFIITNDTKYLKPYGSNSDGILIAASFGKFVLDSKTFNDLELFDFFDFCYNMCNSLKSQKNLMS